MPRVMNERLLLGLVFDQPNGGLWGVKLPIQFEAGRMALVTHLSFTRVH